MFVFHYIVGSAVPPPPPVQNPLKSVTAHPR